MTLSVTAFGGASSPGGGAKDVAIRLKHEKERTFEDMDKIECYKCAMIAVMRDEIMEDDVKLEVLATLMEARKVELDLKAAWSAYQADKGAQE